MFANSRDVADFFGKRHADVMEAIVGMRKSPYTPVDWFQIVPYINEQNGQQYACCDMSQAGFTMLVVGFQGDKAYEFKVRYIQRFNEMEAALREQPIKTPALPQDYRSALLKLTR